MRDGRSEEPAGKKNQTSLSAGEAQLRVVSSQTVPKSVGRTQMFRMFWKWRLVRQTEKGREMRVGCAQVSAGLGHGVRAATGGLWGFPRERGSVRDRGPPKSDMAGPVGRNTAQAFSFVLLLRDNLPPDPFTPRSTAPAQTKKISPHPQIPEISGPKGWERGGRQQEKPPCNTGI